jgi:beta-lactamase class A
MRNVIPRIEQLRRDRRESPVFAASARRGIMDLLDSFAAGDKGRSCAVASLDPGGPLLALRAGVPRPGASLLKIALVAAALDAGRRGRLDLGRRVSRDEIGASRWPSLLDALPAETTLSLAELCTLSIVTSDNGAADCLCRALGLDAVDAWMRAIGCSEAAMMRVGFDDLAIERRGRDNTITAEDGVLILRAIFQSAVYDPLLLALVNNVRNQRIPRFLDDELRVAHKTGTLAGVVNDAGILFVGDAPFIAVFLCDGQSDADRTEGEIAQHSLRLVELARAEPG